MGQVNVITYEAEPTYGTDGYQTKKGNVITYLTTGSTDVNKSSTNSSDTFEELVNDVKTVKDNLLLFNEKIEQKTTFKKKRKNYEGYFVYPVNSNGQRSGDPTIEDVFEPFSGDEEFKINNTFRSQYMILSNDILDENKYETFKQSIIGTLIQSNDVVKIFDDYWLKTARPKFKEENDLTIEFLDYVETNKLKDFTNYKPFNTKSRVFDFSTNYSSVNKPRQEELIKSLNLTTPITTNNSTWNDEKNSVYISKPKLN